MFQRVLSSLSVVMDIEESNFRHASVSTCQSPSQSIALEMSPPCSSLPGHDRSQQQHLYPSTTVVSFLETVVKSHSARAALATLLGLYSHLPSVVSQGDMGWTLLWHTLGLLRDCALLPRSLVIDTEEDILPITLRALFEDHCAEDGPKQSMSLLPTTETKKSKSFLSLQGLGEALFGKSSPTSSSSAALSSSAFASSGKGNNNNNNEFRGLCLRQLRWDAGYEEALPLHPINSPITALSSESVAAGFARVHVSFLAPEFEIPKIVFYSFSPEFIAKNSSTTVIDTTFTCLRSCLSCSYFQCVPLT